MSQIFGSNLFKILSTHTKNSIRQYAQKKKKRSPVIILRPALSDSKRITKLFTDSFYPGEPTSVGLGITKEHAEVLSHFTLMDLNAGYSLMALDRGTGKIAGCSINTVEEKDSAFKVLGLSKCMQTPALSQFFELTAYLRAIPDLYKKLKVKEIFEIGYVAVDQNHRGKGIAFELMKESLKLGHQKGFKVVRVDATNVFTAKICDKLGMKKVFDIPFDLYKGKDGKPLMKIEHPNVSCQVYVHLCNK